MKKPIFILILLLCSAAQARDWSTIQCASDQVIAQEMVKAELAGWRLAGPQSSCLEQKNFNFFAVNNSGVNEGAFLNPELVIENDDTFSIQVSKADGQGRVYKNPKRRRVDFQIRSPNGSKPKYSGTLVFDIFEGTDMKAYFGCAGMYSPPRKLIVRRSCLSGAQ